ncbi:MAG: rhamnogalacturonan acetylesterase [Hymenobacter sp.]|nr:MAG: rhamnogalacturonan acetylesterase [Hymenobacter sp.]
MLSRLLSATAALSLVTLLAFRPAAPAPLKVYLIGDSTMSVKEVKAYPETGWGMPFAAFFDETVAVDNRAQNGRSTKSFLAENRWQPVASELHAGDYVFIQFGHNDEVPTKKSYTPEAEFTANLRRFVSETRSRQAQPVLLTPVARRKFDDAGKVEETHAAYAELVRAVAHATNTPLIDLDRSSQALLQQFGVENSKLLFNHLAPGEHPNYPDGREDNTHFNELGARRMAELVLADIRTLKLGLVDHLRQGTVKKTVDAQAR